ncbi:flagellar export protein FliJ [Candidatus Peregrinibacteria bacterium]|nr:flagellar export protein FliJ [Candidatus Peregrinibacteria bacterium]
MPHKFNFRLEPVLEYRRMLEEKAKRAFAMARREVLLQNITILNFMTEQEKGKMELRKLKVGKVDILTLRQQEAYLNSLVRKIAKAYDELRVLMDKESKKRKELSEATKQVKVIERLKERRYKEYLYGVAREEQKVLDEVGQNMYMRG